MKKCLSLLMAILLVVASMTTFGCAKRGQTGEEIDDKRTQLNVGLFYGGLGRAWLDEAKADFEALYAEHSFEEGKKGVQVVIDARKEEFRAINLATTMELYENVMYICGQSDYDVYKQKNLLVDITDTVKEKVYDENGDLAFVTGKPASLSIYDTMQEDFKEPYQRNGRFYGIPECSSVSGIIYDADMFNDNGYYFYKNGQIGASQEDIDAGECCPGPDGVMGTPDDGMPQNYSNFITLLDTINADGIPFTWSGNTVYQRLYAYLQIWANYEGADEFRLNYTLNGTSRLGAVNPQNADSVLSGQLGRKAAIKMFYDIVTGGYYSSNAFEQKYTEAQTEYVNSIRFDTQKKRIAFFMEGGYWESEVRSSSDAMALEFNDTSLGYGQRDYRLFPIPNFVDNVGGTGIEGIPNQAEPNNKEVILADGGDDLIWITDKAATKNKEVQIEVAKKFLQFIQSREQLIKYTKNTGACFRPYSYKISDDELKTFTKFTQNVYKYMQCSDVLYNVVEHPLVKEKLPNIASKYNFSDGGSISDPASYFNAHPNESVNDCWNKVREQAASSLH